MAAVAAVPHFHYTDEAAVDALMAVRTALASDAALKGLKLTLLPLLVKVRNSGSGRQPWLDYHK